MLATIKAGTVIVVIVVVTEGTTAITVTPSSSSNRHPNGRTMYAVNESVLVGE